MEIWISRLSNVFMYEYLENSMIKRMKHYGQMNSVISFIISSNCIMKFCYCVDIIEPVEVRKTSFEEKTLGIRTFPKAGHKYGKFIRKDVTVKFSASIN